MQPPLKILHIRKVLQCRLVVPQLQMEQSNVALRLGRPGVVQPAVVHHDLLRDLQGLQGVVVAADLLLPLGQALRGGCEEGREAVQGAQAGDGGFLETQCVLDLSSQRMHVRHLNTQLQRLLIVLPHRRLPNLPRLRDLPQRLRVLLLRRRHHALVLQNLRHTQILLSECLLSGAERLLQQVRHSGHGCGAPGFRAVGGFHQRERLGGEDLRG
mmetsp:Transcript_8203/g.19631  ORF Transcript_8203/g.19631 Transcript_8203/m.19631 type:complete len:213 (+) Transcript_8203:217-855(+)